MLDLGCSHSSGAGEQAAVYSIDNGLGTDLAAAEESAVQTLDGILASLDCGEFQIDIALCVGI